jgi:formate hydrogenlyase transcriptional activator
MPNTQTGRMAGVSGLDSHESLTLGSLEWLPVGMLLVRPDGTIVSANRRVEELFGYDRADLVGRPVHLLLPDLFEPTAAEAAENEGPTPGPRSGLHRSGSQIPLDVESRPMETPSGRLVLVSLSQGRGDAGAAAEWARERSAFGHLVADLSVQFLSLPARHVDAAIHIAMRQIGEALDLDRCTFYRVQPNGTLNQPVGWAREGFSLVSPPVNAAEAFPWALQTVRAGQVLAFSSLDEIPSAVDRESYELLGTRSAVTVPLSVDGRLVGAIGFNMLRAERRWTSEMLNRFTVIAAVFNGVLARQMNDEALHEAFAKVQALRDQLAAENTYLRRETQHRFKEAVIGHSAAIQRVMAQLRQVALTDATVLLLGETGTGKELFASQIHEMSARRGRPMIRVNCAAIPATLVESELFGRERGAFTGALARQAGRFELADHSTIFLDEIGDLPGDVQVKLLRVIEERQIERLGSPRAIRIDTRIIAATHRDLEQRITEGAFREDLFYRLNVFPIVVPPLRERAEDIPLLVWRFVEEFARAFGKRVEAIPAENMAALQQYAWPGNVRELRNLVERAVIVAKTPVLSISLPTSSAAAAQRSTKLTDVEREHIREVLESTAWRIRGPGGAAERLGLRPTTLETRMAKLRLVRPKA